MRRTLFLVFIFFMTINSLLFAETIVLKSGKTVEGKIIEETEDYIKLETTDEKSLYYYKNTIDMIKKEGEQSAVVDSSKSNFITGLVDRTEKSNGYMLFVPKNILSDSKVPVLICLPGWGISAKQDINMWRFPAEKNGLIAINFDIDYNSMKFDSDISALYRRIMSTIDLLANEYPIDTQAVYIAGTSAGGMMSISLALNFPDKFKAVGIISGGRIGFGAEGNLSKARSQRFYMIHGKLDKSIPIQEFYTTKERLLRNGAKIEFEVIPQGEHTLASQYYREVVDWLVKTEE